MDRTDVGNICANQVTGVCNISVHHVVLKPESFELSGHDATYLLQGTAELWLVAVVRVRAHSVPGEEDAFVRVALVVADRGNVGADKTNRRVVKAAWTRRIKIGSQCVHCAFLRPQRLCQRC